VCQQAERIFVSPIFSMVVNVLAAAELIPASEEVKKLSCSEFNGVKEFNMQISVLLLPTS